MVSSSWGFNIGISALRLEEGGRETHSVLFNPTPEGGLEVCPSVSGQTRTCRRHTQTHS